MTKRKCGITLPNRTPAFLTLELAAAELCIAPSTFANWVAQGVLPKPCTIGPNGSTQRWRWSELQAFISGKASSDETKDAPAEKPGPFFRVSALHAKGKAKDNRA